MARLPRLVVPHQPHHVIQSGVHGQPVFVAPEDYVAFRGWLREAARRFKVAIHAYVLMPDHIQLLASPSDCDGLGGMMQWIGRQYVPYFNQKYHRAGTLWQGRYKATVVDAEHYFLACSRYIETAPVRAGAVTAPADYPWSSCAHHVGAQPDPVSTDHAQYWALGNTPFDREAAYRALMEQVLTAGEIQTISHAVLKGWALGSERFKARREKETKRRVSPANRGRPAKRPQPVVKA